MALSLDFAFEGFRTIRERPALIALWGAVALFGSGVAEILLVSFSGPAFAQMQPLVGKPGTPDTALLTELARQALPGMFMYAAVNLMTGAVLATAACRATLTPDDNRLGFLRFGGDELRMLVVHTLMAILTLVLLALGGALGAPGGQTGMTLGMFAAGGFVAWLRIRLLLNGPQSFDRKTVDLFGSFALTRPQTGRLILGYAIALVLAVVVWFLCGQTIASLVTLMFGEMARPDFTSLQSYLTPANVVSLVLSGGITLPLVAAIVYGAPAAAYRALKVSGPA